MYTFPPVPFVIWGAAPRALSFCESPSSEVEKPKLPVLELLIN